MLAGMQRNFSELESVKWCPVCGVGLGKLAFSPDVARCDTCRIYYRNPRPTQNAIACSYNSGSTYRVWHENLRDFQKLWNRRVKLVQRWSRAGRLLDIGVGDGGFLKTARAAGFDGEGTELSDTGAAFARNENLTIRMGQFTEMDFGANRYDVITIWHVLEHVPDPGVTLQKIRALLNPGGFLFVAVPNEEHALLRHRLGMLPRAFEPLEFGGEIHLTHFQPDTLKKAVKNAGFEIVRFLVDDFYPDRRYPKRFKIKAYQAMAALFRWHWAAAMICIAKPTV